MNAALIVFPGSNCDRDAFNALSRVTGRDPATIWYTETSLPACDLIVVPGGFTYGDYLRVGAMAARAPVMRTVADRAADGVAVLGICNGFQILTECGLLPGALMRNASLTFVARDVHLSVERTDTVFTGQYRDGAVIRVPVAHHDGCYFADDATLDTLEGDGRVAFRYARPNGDDGIVANPNGSARDIAGIYNEDGNVLGLMPHPERAVDRHTGGRDGRPLFDSLAEAFA